MSVVTLSTFDTQFEQLQTYLEQTPELVVDVETNGLEWYGFNQICGLGVGEPTSSGFLQYYPFRHHQGENLTLAHLKQVIELLNSHVQTYIGYNLKFDAHFLEKEGVQITDKTLIDVLVMVRLIEHSETKDLALTPTASRNYGPEAVQYDIDTKKELRANKWHKDFSMAPPDMLGEYCKKDVYLTANLYVDYLKQIHKTNQEQVFKLECDLTSVLYSMEAQGISIDKQYAAETKEALLARMKEVVQEIYSITGCEFNISSPAQIGEVFKTMGIESPVKTAKGNDSWNEAALVNINNRVAGLIRQHRTLEKLSSTYLDPYLSTSKMHTSFCNWGTATGRLSSKDPNLQNIPRNHFKLKETILSEIEQEEVRQKISAMVSSKGIDMTTHLDADVLGAWSFVGDESYDASDEAQIAIRRLFVPSPEYSLISFDYSQMEVRVFLSYLHNDSIAQTLQRKDVDFHAEAAKLAFQTTEEDEQFKFYRQAAKAITFGTIYGIGNAKLAKQLGTEEYEAKEFKRRYFEGLEGSLEFCQDVQEAVATRGWIKNKYGRRYRIPPYLAYKGVNYLVQGTSADILSERMIVISNYLKNTQSRILLQVHDEIICEIHNSELNTLPAKIRELLEVNTLNIPLTVDMEICTPSWATKKDFIPKPKESILDFIDWSLIPEK